MSKHDVEQIKRESHHLRGSLSDELLAEGSGLSEEGQTLIKFHGSYQQENRDTRKGQTPGAREKSFSFMVRSKIPGGRITAKQYLAHDELARRLGGETLRITSRQGLQIHGILKEELRSTIASIAACGLTTWGACGDVVRNVCAPSSPVDDVAHRDAVALSSELAVAFASPSRAYSEIWLEEERLDSNGEEETEPLFGETYLPRKFKIGIVIPPRNDVDVFAHDVGLVSHVEGGVVTGYTLLMGGGMGMTHNKEATYPALAEVCGFIPRDRVVAAVRAAVEIHRDFGDRTDRKHARLKYVVTERGIEWIREELGQRLGFDVQPIKALSFHTVEDPLGWHVEGEDRHFYGMWIEDGRISNGPHGNYLDALAEIARRFAFDMRLTPNTNVLFCGIRESDRSALTEVLKSHGIPEPEKLTLARQVSQACVALPTCGLALAEGERAFDPFMKVVDGILDELGMRQEPLLVRMTGCPNGCARPYLADIALVGRSPGKYAIYLGGSIRGDRLATLVHKLVPIGEIPDILRSVLSEFREARNPGETFGDYWQRSRGLPVRREPRDFHVELAQRS